MRITLLGTGTSTGVPVPGCDCSICSSPDPKNHRLRVSVLVELPKTKELESTPFSILIDTSPDLRAQALRTPIRRIDGVLFTHGHADHINGFDDLRPFFFLQRTPIPIYANHQTLGRLKKIFDYAFDHDPSYKGGLLPQLVPYEISPLLPFSLGPVEILPLPLLHGSMEVLGFRLGNFAYLTDCSEIPNESLAALGGLEVLVIDGLRESPHPTHFNLAGAVRIIEQITPKQSYLTHISHDLDYSEANEKLKALTSFPVELGFDGLTIDLPEPT